MPIITTLEEQLKAGRAARKAGGWHKLVEKETERQAKKEPRMTDKSLPIAMVVERAVLAKEMERSLRMYSDASIRFITPSTRLEGTRFSVIVIAHDTYRQICTSRTQLEWFRALQMRTMNSAVIEL